MPGNIIGMNISLLKKIRANSMLVFELYACKFITWNISSRNGTKVNKTQIDAYSKFHFT